jgi:hypothetical protein
MGVTDVEVSLGDGCLAVNAVTEAATRVNADWVAAAKDGSMLCADWDVNVGEAGNVRVLSSLDLNSSSLAGLANKVNAAAAEDLARSGSILEALLLNAVLLVDGRAVQSGWLDDSEAAVVVAVERHGYCLRVYKYRYES